MQADKDLDKGLHDIYLVPLKYGGLAAVLSIILFLVLYYFNKNPLLIPPILDYRIILYPIILVFAIREFKENKNNGFLHFWQGMSIGLQAIFLISFIMGSFILFFGGIIEPGFTNEYIQQMMDRIGSVDDEVLESVGRETIAKTLEIIPTTTTLDLALDYFLKSLPYGIFLTIIISLILRKKPKF